VADIDDSIPPTTGSIFALPIQNNFKALRGRVNALPDALDPNGNQCTAVINRPLIVGSAGAKVAAPGDTVDFAGAAARGALLAITTLTGNTTLGTQHTGHLLIVDSTATVVLTVDGSAIPIGWHCTILRAGTGDVGVAAAGGISLRHPDNHTRIFARYDMASLIKATSSDLIFAGRTKP
jgi:hypothetical protein